MANFRYSPEWQQAADRHSQLIDPVLLVRKLSRFEGLAQRHPTRFDNAHVYATAKGSYETYLPPQRPQLTGRGYTAVYEVDIGVHRFHAGLDLPSDNDAFEFGTDVELTWQVVDPAAFVDSGQRDVPAMLLAEIQQCGRPVTRGFAIDDSAEAERALLAALSAAQPLGAAVGLRVESTVRVRRDRASITHQQNLQAIGHAAAEAVHSNREGMTYDAVVDERMQQQLRHQHAQAMLSGRNQIEQQALESQKIAWFQHHLEQGGVAAWAMQLAQHPEDCRLVMQSMREDQLRLLQSQLDVVTQVLASEHTEAYQLEGVQETALQVVRSFLAQQHPGLPGAPAPGPYPQLPPGAVPPQQYAPPGPAPYPPVPYQPGAPGQPPYAQQPPPPAYRQPPYGPQHAPPYGPATPPPYAQQPPPEYGTPAAPPPGRPAAPPPAYGQPPVPPAAAAAPPGPAPYEVPHGAPPPATPPVATPYGPPPAAYRTDPPDAGDAADDGARGTDPAPDPAGPRP